MRIACDTVASPGPIGTRRHGLARRAGRWRSRGRRPPAMARPRRRRRRRGWRARARRAETRTPARVTTSPAGSLARGRRGIGRPLRSTRPIAPTSATPRGRAITTPSSTMTSPGLRLRRHPRGQVVVCPKTSPSRTMDAAGCAIPAPARGCSLLATAGHPRPARDPASWNRSRRRRRGASRAGRPPPGRTPRPRLAAGPPPRPPPLSPRSTDYRRVAGQVDERDRRRVVRSGIEPAGLDERILENVSHDPRIERPLQGALLQPGVINWRISAPRSAAFWVGSAGSIARAWPRDVAPPWVSSRGWATSSQMSSYVSRRVASPAIRQEVSTFSRRRLETPRPRSRRRGRSARAPRRPGGAGPRRLGEPQGGVDRGKSRAHVSQVGDDLGVGSAWNAPVARPTSDRSTRHRRPPGRTPSPGRRG